VSNSPALTLASLPEAERAEKLGQLNERQIASLRWNWRFWAREEQLEPEGDWLTWLILAGRGFGKTRTLAETVRGWVCGQTPLQAGRYARIALVAETAADARDVIVEGESGLLAVHPRDFRPQYEPSKRRLTWPNGAVATLYNATEPDQLRGPQHDAAACDELAKWREADDTWANLMLGLRLGSAPRCVVATTPRPITLLRKLIADAKTVTTRGRTADNAVNLAEPFLKTVEERYGGTRLGRQELEGEMLDDMPGALWKRAWLDEGRRQRPETLDRVVVAIDPAASAGETADETGVVVAGVAEDADRIRRGYVLEDCSVRGSPEEWARAAVAAYDRWNADRIIAEANNGGEMIATVIRTVRPGMFVELVHASRGKAVRAEPISALFEQGRVHLCGSFPELEDQLCSFTPWIDRSKGSPDRADAMVWALSALFDRMNAKPLAPVAEKPPVRGAGAWMR
jgi:phage terminase large subunit-like protein